MTIYFDFYRDSLREIETESKALPGGWCQIFGKE